MSIRVKQQQQMQTNRYLQKRTHDAKSSRTSPRFHWMLMLHISRRRERLANVRSLKQVVNDFFFFFWDLYPSLHLFLPPSLPLAVTPLPLSPSSLGRIKGWGRGSLRRLLGLVMHRFDIHIKRETGCFDVCVCGGGGRSQETAEVAHFFFYWHSIVSGGLWWRGARCW